MSRQRLIILCLCVAAFVLLSAALIQNRIQFNRTNFQVGSVPMELVNQILPKDVPLSSMRPPAIRASDPIRFGNATSLISIIEYADYQCEGCQAMDAVIHRIARQYGGKVRVVWRDLPAESVHRQAIPAAAFARCAGLQGAYWPVHDELMQASSLGESTYDTIIKDLGLDRSFINACRKSDEVAAAIREDADEARGDGIKSVPFFYVGTQAFDGAIDEDMLKAAIETALGS
ncbi:DsbA family protein [Patescibacteria group bacterium]|nr:DsbA family protein [Patescibacteria group bacterium]MBU1448219.1 DsbA family protein [Patescibacteria group bacterium]MBU2612996.1 DsbA family protein [Patescibacteria group bacterium]